MDTFRLHALDDIKFAVCDGHEMLLIADDNLDRCKLSVTKKGEMLIFDPSDQSISEDLKLSLAHYLE